MKTNKKSTQETARETDIAHAATEIDGKSIPQDGAPGSRETERKKTKPLDEGGSKKPKTMKKTATARADVKKAADNGSNALTVKPKKAKSDKSPRHDKNEPMKATTPLTAKEAKTLAKCEKVITKNKRALLEAGEALATINKQRLYRSTHTSFGDYCVENWGFERAWAYRLISGFKLTAKMVANGDTILPKGESQTRVLAKLPAAKHRDAMVRAKELAGEKRVVTAHVKAAVDEILAVEKPDTDEVDTEGEAETVVALPESLNPISIRQLLDWLEAVELRVKAEEDKNETLKLVGKIKMGLEYRLDEELEAAA